MIDHPSIISADALQAKLEELSSNQKALANKLVIIDTRFALHDKTWGLTSYKKSHIPGARFLDLEKDLSSPVAEHGGRHPLPDIDQLTKTFANLGIHKNETEVVIYDDNQLGFACRCWWLLRYLGHEEVSILNGGFSAWVNRGNKPVSDDEYIAIQPVMGSFTATPNVQMTVNLTMVQKISENQSKVLIDSREPLRYLGKKEPIDPVAGHIPSAINKSWQEITTMDGFIRPINELRNHWSKLKSNAPIVYCGSGVTACVNLFSLHLIGKDKAKLYPGSWSDWCSYQENPIATSGD